MKVGIGLVDLGFNGLKRGGSKNLKLLGGYLSVFSSLCIYFFGSY